MIIRTSAHPEQFSAACSASPALRKIVTNAEDAPRCNRHSKVMTHADHPGDAFVTCPDCKSRKCVSCRPRRDLDDVTHFFDCLAPYSETIHAAEVPAGTTPRGVKDAARKAGVLFRWMKVKDGSTVFLFSDRMPGSRPLTLDQAGDLLARLLPALAAGKATDGSRAWAKPREEAAGGYKLVAVGPGRNAAAAVEELVRSGAKVVSRSHAGRSVRVRFDAADQEQMREALQRVVRYVRRTGDVTPKGCTPHAPPGQRPACETPHLTTPRRTNSELDAGPFALPPGWREARRERLARAG